MFHTLRSAYQFARKNDGPTIWSAVIRKDTHPFIQFLKYGLCGGGAVLIYQATFGVLGRTVFPHFESACAGADPVSPEERKLYFVLASTAGFVLADIFGYVANLRWVFEGGRHNRVLEFLLFTGVACIGWGAGMVPGYYAYGEAHAGSWLSSGIVTITSIMVNYASRKMFIFRR